MKEDFQHDIEKISRIPIVSSMLDVICQSTGMGFAAIARVTDKTWIACCVRDDIGFGLKPGGELKLDTTICHEIRQSGKSVVIDHVNEDEHFINHHTPAMYGFQSYISVPVIRKDGTFFGTLCAIDPNPHILSSPQVTGMFSLFADLISFHLEAVEQNEINTANLMQERAFNNLLEEKIKERTLQLEEKNNALLQANKELQAFNYISSHDLQEPLRKIQTFVSLIDDSEKQQLSERGRNYFKRLKLAASRMQVLINDLLSYSRTDLDERKFEMTHIGDIVQELKEDMKDELEEKQATLESGNLDQLRVISFQFRQLLYNLISNSLKFSSPSRKPLIKIESTIADAKSLGLNETTMLYCHICVSDNGIGFSQQYSEKIFELFQRLHQRDHYAGTGIGLAIARKITENHNGFIRASGKENEGASFDIFLPMII